MKRTWIWGLVLGLACAGPVWAEELPGSAEPPEARLQALQKLRAEDPQAFARLVSERKQAIKQQMQTLRQENPERFAAAKQQVLQQRRERLNVLREKDPEKFRQAVEHRQQRLESFRQQHPEQFERWASAHPKAARRMQTAGEKRVPPAALRERRVQTQNARETVRPQQTPQRMQARQAWRERNAAGAGAERTRRPPPMRRPAPNGRR